MKRTIAELTERYDKLGIDLVPTLGTDPQAWTAIDRLTGEVEDFREREANTIRWHEGHHTAADRMFYFVVYFGSRLELRDHRIRYLAAQGKTIGETASALGIGWTTIAHHRQRLRLPHQEPRGARQAFEEKSRPGSTKPRAPSPTRLAVARLLDEMKKPGEIARELGISTQRVHQIRVELGVPARREVSARRQRLVTLVNEGIIDAATLARCLRVSTFVVRADARVLGLPVLTAREIQAQRRAAVAVMAGQGVTMRDMADRWGCSRTTIETDCHVLNIRQKRDRWNKGMVQARCGCVRELMDQGLGRVQIAERLSLQLHTVDRDLKAVRAESKSA